MKLRNLWFVTTQGCQDTGKALETTDRLEDMFSKWCTEKRIMGYTLFTGLVERNYETYNLDREMIERITHGAFPFIFLSVTFDREAVGHVSGYPLELVEVVQEYGFQLADSFLD
jgi:hypothetical protein